MDHITFHEGDNMGGARAFRFAPIEDFTALPLTVQGVIIDEPSFVSGKDWYTGRVTEDSADFSEKEKRVEGVLCIESTFTGDVPGDDIPQRRNLDDIMRHHLIVDVVDNNGIWRRMGTLTNPARFFVDYGTGRTAAARNGYGVRITSTQEFFTPIVDPDFEPEFEASGSGSGV